jgi:serine/threonine protein phosphatase PrpC
VVEDLLERLLASDTNSGIGCDNMTAILIAIKP